MTDNVREVLAEHGIVDVVDVRDTASELDRTYLVETTTGRVVLKESPAGSHAVRMQAALLELTAERAPGLPVPALIANRTTGAFVTETADGTAFVTTFCTGAPLEDAVLTAAIIDDIVATQSTLSAALETADAGALHVPAANDWSIDSVTAYEHLVDDVAEERHRDRLHAIIAGFRTEVEPRRDALPQQVIHADFNLSNLLVADGRITGIIDFGDAVYAPRVYDVAVTACYLALALGDVRHELVTRYVGAMTTACGLGPLEVSLITPLVLSRLAIVVLLARESARTDPARAEYVLRYDDLAERLMDTLLVDAVVGAPATEEGTS